MNTALRKKHDCFVEKCSRPGMDVEDGRWACLEHAYLINRPQPAWLDVTPNNLPDEDTVPGKKKAKK